MTSPRIMLIHALAESVVPIHAAFARAWEGVETHDLMDTSLSADLAAQGGVLSPAIVERFRTLGRYAAEAGPNGRRADGILFTCSAFGAAIDAVKADLAIPVLKPNETAFEAAVARGGSVVLLTTFPPALKPMLEELSTLARRRDPPVVVRGIAVDGALAALKAGRPEEHDRLIAEAAAGLEGVDTIVLGQFSMARAADAVRGRTAATVLTTPDSAVQGIRRAVEAR